MDKKQVIFRIEPDKAKKLKILAIEQDRSLNDMLLEAVRDLLKKYGKAKK